MFVDIERSSITVNYCYKQLGNNYYLTLNSWKNCSWACRIPGKEHCKLAGQQEYYRFAEEYSEFVEQEYKQAEEYSEFVEQKHKQAEEYSEFVEQKHKQAEYQEHN